ncbi:thioredoxin [Actinomycetospora sp. TBRC 11914]|uniref:thioredoxin n=1 Tax=Actinomycetospora sp. TBRC 11914 TaxID=2729387 RepID=UPI00145E063C|nr:thioredoxin [Actinomycetospora sp. TBRC 11914]NMO93075.1 thioredoxin [Actinomycetospora sp. TBRC 11914]
MTTTARLPVEGDLPGLGGATSWLHSEPLSPAGLRGRVVVAQFCTFSCVNWLRTVPYVTAWADRYRDDGLVVVGIHSPEFPFEEDVGRVRQALAGLGITYPVALDNDFAVWEAFGNRYWPALYFADAEGRLRHHHFGEEDYERSETVIRDLLAEAGSVVGDQRVAVAPRGVSLPADLDTLGSPETYVGYARASGFASPGGVRRDHSQVYAQPRRLGLDRWSLSGAWTVGPRHATLDEPGGRLSHRGHARDVNLVMGARDGPVRVTVRLDGAPPGPAHGLDVDDGGRGTVTDARLYQLIRQPGRITSRTVDITFDDAGAEAYVFTFG